MNAWVIAGLVVWWIMGVIGCVRMAREVGRVTYVELFTIVTLWWIIGPFLLAMMFDREVEWLKSKDEP
jgi:uncharacterized membrane protein